MSDVTFEKKLQLIRQVRSRYNEDLCDLSDREQLLFGKTSLSGREKYPSDSLHSSALYPYNADYAKDGVPEEEQEPSSFKLRFLIAVMLFGLVVFMDRSHTAIGGITADKLYTAIASDYEDKLQDWVEALSGSANP